MSTRAARKYDEEKRKGKKAVDPILMPCPVDTVCEECSATITKGDYVHLVDEDGYVFYIHEKCNGGTSD